MLRPLAFLLVMIVTNGALAVDEWRDPETGMVFVKIPKGCFRMGTAKPVSPKPDLNWNHYKFKEQLAADEQPAHEVCVDEFWLGKYEVTETEWRQLAGLPSAEPQQARKPKAGITWHEASRSAQRLNERSDNKSRHFRLPTEAEWEYACLAKQPPAPVAYGAELINSAWYSAPTIRAANPFETGKLPPNVFGLHDMLGNVWEWVQDEYQQNAYSVHSLYNPVVGNGKGGQRVIRGGSVRSEPMQVRCGTRSRYAASEGLGRIGFRLVMEEKKK